MNSIVAFSQSARKQAKLFLDCRFATIVLSFRSSQQKRRNKLEEPESNFDDQSFSREIISLYNYDSKITVYFSPVINNPTKVIITKRKLRATI